MDSEKSRKLFTGYPQWHLYNIELSTASPQGYAQVIHSKLKVIHSLYTLKVKLHTGYPQVVLSYPHVIQSSIVDTVIPLYTTVDTVPDQHCVGCDCVVKCE